MAVYIPLPHEKYTNFEIHYKIKKTLQLPDFNPVDQLVYYYNLLMLTYAIEPSSIYTEVPD